MAQYKLFCEGIIENDYEKVYNSFSKPFLKKELDLYKTYPLCMASNNGAYDIVKYFISQGCDIECEDSFNHMRPLHYAAVNGKLDVAKLLVKHGANKEASTHRKVRPVHFSVCGNHVNVFRYLLSVGVQTNIITEEEDLGNRSIFDIMRKCNYFECEDFYKKWVDYDTNIFDMVRRNELKNFKAAFFEEKIAVSQKNLNVNVVDIAVEKQAREFLTYIFKQDPDEKNVVKAFYRILKQRNVSASQFVKQYRLYHSILFNIHEEFHANLFIETVNSKWIATGESFLEICVANERFAFIEAILPYILEVTESWTTAIDQLDQMDFNLMEKKLCSRLRTMQSCETNDKRLLLAVQDRNLPMVKYLLDKNGAKMTESDELQSNPLILAINLNYDEIAEVLIKQEQFWGQMDMDGRLPLMHALLNKNFTLVDKMINDIDIRYHSKLFQLSIIPLAVLHQQISVIRLFFFHSKMLKNIMPEKPCIPLNRFLINPLVPISFDRECVLSLYLKLHRYVPDKFSVIIEEHFTQLGEDFNDIYFNLHLSVRLLNKEMILMLLSTNYPVNMRDKFNFDNNLLLSLLTQSIEPNSPVYYEIMKILVQHGVDITEKNQLDQSALSVSYDCHKSLQIILSSPLIQNQNIPIEPIRLLKFYQNEWNDVLKKLLPNQSTNIIKELIVLCSDPSNNSCEMIDLIEEYKSNDAEWSVIVTDMLVSTSELDREIGFNKFLNYFKLNETDDQEDDVPRNVLSEIIEKGDREYFSLEFCHQNSEVLSFLLKIPSTANQESCLHAAVKKKYLKVFELLLLEIQECSILEQTSILSENKSPLELLLLLYQESIESAKLEKIIKIMIKIGYDIHHQVTSDETKVPLVSLIKNDRLKDRLMQFHKREFDKRASEFLKIEEAVKNDLGSLSNLCSICTENEIDHSIEGCGHTFCSTCIFKLDKCPYCRVYIRNRQRIFLTQS